MPLVALETAIHPPQLLQEAAFVLGSKCLTSQWWVVHTRPRAEKALARQLLARDIAYYLPCHERQWKSRGRVLRSQLPLFSGYLFLHGDHHTRVRALETNLVAMVIPVVDQSRLHQDLVRVERLIATGAPLTPEERLEPGAPVEMTAGPLAGLRGAILRRGKHLKFLVSVEFLGRGVSAEVDSWMFEPAKDRNVVFA
jgi:transcription antitermination factor NusG